MSTTHNKGQELPKEVNNNELHQKRMQNIHAKTKLIIDLLNGESIIDCKTILQWVGNSLDSCSTINAELYCIIPEKPMNRVTESI